MKIRLASLSNPIPILVQNQRKKSHKTNERKEITIAIDIFIPWMISVQ